MAVKACAFWAFLTQKTNDLEFLFSDVFNGNILSVDSTANE